LSRQEWEQMLARFFERVMAAAVAGVDPEPFKKELSAIMSQEPAKKEQKHEPES